MSKKKVLFICTHNSARSQMAEGFLTACQGSEEEILAGFRHSRDEIKSWIEKTFGEKVSTL